jgi:hypothetical protein
MRIKELLKTKTFWSGVGLAVYGVINQDWEAFLTGLSVIFLRDAINKVQVQKDEDRDGHGLP